MNSSIKILVLNVKDADAIIIHLQKEGKHLVMLIDGGHPGDCDLVIEKLSPILEVANKKAPDLIVCSHYDMDHIGGLKAIINYYKTNIGQILIHRTSEILEIPNLFNKAPKSSSILPSESDLIIGGEIDFMDIRKDENIDTILEGIKQEIELINLIDNFGISCAEPVVDNYIIKGWEEIRLIGPTQDYYKKLFPKHFNAKEFLLQESLELKGEAEELKNNKDDYTLNPCELLDSLKKCKVTSPNLNSAILKINYTDKVFLFTGDAGIDSFINIPSYKEEIKNIFWLKVPHHGSRNNLTCNLITLMSPQISVISGDRHIDDSVVGCLKAKGSKVDITRDLKKDLEYFFTFSDK